MLRCHWAPIDGFLLMVSSNKRPNTALCEISLQNMSDLDFDLSMSVNVKSNGAVALPIYDFPLVSDRNYMPSSDRLGVIAIRKKIISVIIRAKCRAMRKFMLCMLRCGACKA